MLINITNVLPFYHTKIQKKIISAHYFLLCLLYFYSSGASAGTKIRLSAAVSGSLIFALLVASSQKKSCEFNSILPLLSTFSYVPSAPARSSPYLPYPESEPYLQIRHSDRPTPSSDPGSVLRHSGNVFPRSSVYT